MGPMVLTKQDYLPSPVIILTPLCIVSLHVRSQTSIKVYRMVNKCGSNDS